MLLERDVQKMELTSDKKNSAGIRQLLNVFLDNPRLKRLAVLIFFNAAGFGISNGVIKLFLFPFLFRVSREPAFSRHSQLSPL
jgi:hypothetical protein